MFYTFECSMGDKYLEETKELTLITIEMSRRENKETSYRLGANICKRHV